MPGFDVESLVQEEVAAGNMTLLEAGDVVAQQGLFELNRATIEQEHQGEVVGFVGGNMVTAACEGDLLDVAEETAPESLLYYEEIPVPEEEE
jgi:hypothetical protein